MNKPLSSPGADSLPCKILPPSISALTEDQLCFFFSLPKFRDPRDESTSGTQLCSKVGSQPHIRVSPSVRRDSYSWPLALGRCFFFLPIAETSDYRLTAPVPFFPTCTGRLHPLCLPCPSGIQGEGWLRVNDPTTSVCVLSSGSLPPQNRLTGFDSAKTTTTTTPIASHR